MTQIMLISLLGAALLGAAVCGVMLRLMLALVNRKKMGLVVKLKQYHESPVPRFGGFAFLPAILVAVMLTLGVDTLLGESGLIENQASAMERIIMFGLPALFCTYTLGIFDDIISVTYGVKFIVQIIIAVLFVAGGISVSSLHGFCGVGELSPVVSWLLSVLLIVGILNAMNLIDGIDGLAAGIATTALVVYGAMMYIADRYFDCLIVCASLGMLIPFWYINVYGNPERGRKSFMGDTGSLTLGVIICYLAMMSVRVCPLTELNGGVLVWAFSPVAFISIDMLRVFSQRIFDGVNPFLPDRRHLHYMLIDAGYSPTQTLWMLLSLSLIMIGLNMLLASEINALIILILDIVIYSGVFLFAKSRLKKTARLHAKHNQ